MTVFKTSFNSPITIEFFFIRTAFTTILETTHKPKIPV